jgi:hypothetical protein
MRVWTIGHGTKTIEELVATLHEAGVETLALALSSATHCGSARGTEIEGVHLCGALVA